jgi:hypothetical protein
LVTHFDFKFDEEGGKGCWDENHEKNENIIRSENSTEIAHGHSRA